MRDFIFRGGVVMGCFALLSDLAAAHGDGLTGILGESAPLDEFFPPLYQCFRVSGIVA
jgi:hypothetical protein